MEAASGQKRSQAAVRVVQRPPLRRIVVLNPKGGSGKTTLSTNLAGFYAAQGFRTALLDYDSQGSSSFWLDRRAGSRPTIEGIPAWRQPLNVTRNWHLRVSPDTERLVVDTPAALDVSQFRPTLEGAAAIIIPVLPSDIDIHAVSNCIANLLMQGGINREPSRIAIVANRVRRNTQVYQRLIGFLHSLRIPFICTLRDTQNYIRAAEQGVALSEMSAAQVREDMPAWEELIRWIESRPLPEPELRAG